MRQPASPNIHPENRQAWNERARLRKRHTSTARPEHFKDPLRALDPENWLGGNVKDKRVLCLAAGGGLAGILFAAAGGRVTVVDISEGMLELDRAEAAKHNLPLELVRASMDDLGGLGDAIFDIVNQPVSTCYVPDLAKVYREIARVTKPGGIYISMHKQPASLQADALPTGRGYLIQEPYYTSNPLPASIDCLHRESDTVEYIHRWEQLIGELCRSGFVLEDLREPNHIEPKAAVGEFGHRSAYLPPYVKIKARKIEQPPITASLIWNPN
jgi:SAM-dependent methyltransferase